MSAFRPPREVLRGSLEEAIRRVTARGGYLFGICVGFQLLFEVGEEHGETDGLGLIPGRITRLPDEVTLPHIGWNRLIDEPDTETSERAIAELARTAHDFFMSTAAPPR